MIVKIYYHEKLNGWIVDTSLTPSDNRLALSVILRLFYKDVLNLTFDRSYRGWFSQNERENKTLFIDYLVKNGVTVYVE